MNLKTLLTCLLSKLVNQMAKLQDIYEGRFQEWLRRSPLFQGVLEIACKVSVEVPGTIKNPLLMDWYFELMRSLYTEPKNEVILGSFLRPVDVPCTPKSNARKKKVKTPVPAEKPKSNRDIRTMFQHMKRKNNETNIGSTIVIDPWLWLLLTFLNT